MGVYILIIVLLIFLSISVFLYHRRSLASTKNVPIDEDSICKGCSFKKENCLLEDLKEKFQHEIEYFDDEELDVFKGREKKSYSPREIEMFAEVLHTMRPDEVKDWICSLSQRGIKLPTELQDEAILLSKNRQ